MEYCRVGGWSGGVGECSTVEWVGGEVVVWVCVIVWIGVVVVAWVCVVL